MSRLTVVVIAVLMIAWGAATATDAAAASPVQNVQCFSRRRRGRVHLGADLARLGREPVRSEPCARRLRIRLLGGSSGRDGERNLRPRQQWLQRDGLGERQRVDHRERLLDGSGPRCDGPREPRTPR